MWLSQQHLPAIGMQMQNVLYKSDRGDTFHFYLYRASEASKFNKHKQLCE